MFASNRTVANPIHAIGIKTDTDVAPLRRNFLIRTCNRPVFRRVSGTLVNGIFPMNDEMEVAGDGPWQSLRLGFGAILLILGGLGLFLLDSSTHISTAQSAIAIISHHP